MKPNKFRIKSRLVLFGIFCFILNFAYADYIYTDYEGLWYELYTDAKTATCLGLTDGSTGSGSLVIPDYVEYNGEKYSVTAIGNNAFDGCSGFSGTLTLPNSVTSIGDYAFDGCTGFYGSLTLPQSLTRIGVLAFTQCAGFTGTLTIPDSVVIIDDGAFQSCSGLIGTLTIPDSVTTIGDYAFSRCSGFNGILKISDSVVRIGDVAFGYCSGFSGTLTIPDSVTSIGAQAFYSCTGFNESLILGKSLSSIAYRAFWETYFETIFSYNPVPPNCLDEVFYDSAIPLYVPEESIEQYREAKYWQNFNVIYGIQKEEVSSIQVTPSSVEINIGQGVQLSCEVEPQNADWEITWTSSDPSIAEVNQNGYVTAISQGLAIIYARSENGVTGAALVTVVDNSVSAVTITPENVILEINETAQLTAHISPEFADSKITWSSLDPAIAMVNENGLVTAVGKGATFIYATADNGVSGKASVVVLNSKEVSSVEIVPGNLEILVGSEEQLQAIVTPSTSDTAISWLSSNPSVAEVTEEGVVIALSPGLAIIYAFAENGMTGLATVKVVTNEVTAVTIEPDILTIEIEMTGQFTASIEPSVAETTLTWTSNDPEIATVNEDGIVEAKGQGVTVITATADNGVAGMAIVKVIDPNAEDNPDFGYGDNGVYVSAVRIREGDQLGLFAERPTGYENNDWQYEWYLGDNLEAEGKNVLVPAGMESGWTGTVQNVTTEAYHVDITNLAGDEIILDVPEVRVYSRPLTPDELIRKGDGATHSFIAMSSLSDTELSKLGYSFVFGYYDAEGVSHVISNSNLRYCHTTSDIYNREGYRFWVYTTWTFPDGATITSGLRYLDGTVNERFDRSDFNMTRTTGVDNLGAENSVGIYTLNGIPVGKDTDRLAPGIYIIREIKDNVVSSRKVIIK